MLVWNTIIGAAGGFCASVMPDLIQIVKDRLFHSQSIESQQQIIDAAKSGYEFAIQKDQDLIQAQTEQIAALQAKLTTEEDECTDHNWIKFFRSSVRPVVTYSLILLFAIVKLISVYHAYHVEHLDVTHALPVLWDEDTSTVFSGVITFWFGSRSFSKKGSHGVKRPQSSVKSAHTLQGSGVYGE